MHMHGNLAVLQSQKVWVEIVRLKHPSALPWGKEQPRKSGR